MRGSNALFMSTQTTLIGKKNAMGAGFINPKIKNNLNTYKFTNKPTNKEIVDTRFDPENVDQIEKKVSHILPNSKKIQKPGIDLNMSRMALENLTNYYQNKLPVQTTIKTITIQKPQQQLQPRVFLEDGIKKTKNYVSLTYLNTHTRKSQQFYCFHDRDLEINAEHSLQTIEHTCDNDCSTDEDQIKGAVRNLYKNLETFLQEQRKEEILPPKP